MKKLLVILFVVLLCGCSKPEEIVSDECEFLTSGDWEGKDEQCVNVISFEEDGSFSNWCHCGSPVGAGDVSEAFRYRASDHALILLDGEGEIVETGKVLYADDMYLVVDLWERIYVYEDLNEECPTVHDSALKYTGTEETTKPCLSILDYENGMLTVSSYDYDGDAAESFDVWELPTSEEIQFSAVSVTVHNDNESVENEELVDNDYENIGDFYTYGYVEINSEGKVASVVFYGESIIYE